MDRIGQPFALSASQADFVSVPTRSMDGSALLAGLWLVGFLIVVFAWIRQWQRLRALVRAGSPMELGLSRSGSSVRGPAGAGCVWNRPTGARGAGEHHGTSDVRAMGGGPGTRIVATCGPPG